MNMAIAAGAAVQVSTSPGMPLRHAVVLWSAVLGLAFLLAAVRCLCRGVRSPRAS